MKPALALLFLASVAFALVPADLHNEDVLVAALYHSEPFQNVQSHVPNTLEDSRAKLQSLVAANPERAEMYQALATVDENRGDFASAEKDLLTFVEKSGNHSDAYSALEYFYHQHLRFEDELLAMQKHAEILPIHKQDIALSQGKYALYRKMSQHIATYRLNTDARAPYLSAISTYPDQVQPYLDYIDFLKTEDPKAALQAVEKLHTQFPDQTDTCLLTKASLLSNDDAFDLLNQAFDPLWSDKLVRAFDSHLTATGHKRDYLNVLQERLEKNPLDTDAVVRLFYAFYLAGNPMEAQNTLNDFRLLKEQQVMSKQSSWTTKELLWMAKLNQKLLNYNEAARNYYALYTRLTYKPEPKLSPDVALNGLFETILAAEDRPIQLGAGSLDYYKDIAEMDQDPGILNGILSLLFNGIDPSSEWQAQQEKASGYFNRAEALRLVRFTQKLYPQSPFLSGMYRDALKIYDKYGMNQLIVEAGEEFFRTFKDTPEILDVGIEVTDAYARLQNHPKEWATYQFLLPIAAQRNSDNSLFYSEPASANNEDDGQAPQPGQTRVDYQFLLNRYIASLTAEHNNMEVVRLYKQEISTHPDEQTLYENFANYLAQNQLFDEEKKVYQQAIDRFQNQGWYEKLARWYLRKQRNDEYEALSRKIMDIFKGTEIESYLQDTLTGSDSLRLALNLYAHQKFPLNLKFVQNLLVYYAGRQQWTEWETLSAEYYFLDKTIRENYLAWLSHNNRLPENGDRSNAMNVRFDADIQAWRSHFEEAADRYREISNSYPSDPDINLRLADLERSLGVQNIQNYYDSAAIRERLATLNPTDSEIWTNAGETLADIEQYDDARKYWNEILKIDPYNPDRFIEVATIFWDYYLFDDALNTISKIRTLQKDDSLFAYEAGAIYESKRDYPHAIDEYARSLADHSEMAWSRLGELYQRKKYTAMIRSEIDSQLKKNDQDEKIWSGTIAFYAEQKEKDIVRTLLSDALKTLKPEPFENIVSTLKRTAADLGFFDLQVQLIQRQISDSQEDVDRWNRMLELARFYEASRKPADAEAIYRDLYNHQPHSAGIIQQVVSYYWRTEQFDKAFAIYQQALSASNTNWHKKYLLETANRYRERKDYASALAASRELLTVDPLNGEYFQLVAEILAEQKDFAGLNEHYKQGLKRVAESQLSADEKKARIAQLRHGIIQANIILKDYTAALDQYIEIINRDAESEEVLKEAAEFASRYALTQRLFDYYSKTAAGSPKDHRWPMVLGRLNLYSGNFDEAILQFQTAIQIRPERTDFYQQVAETYQRLGKYQEALVQYQKAYEISFKNPDWLNPMSELHARLGHRKEALQLYSETFKNISPMQTSFSLCARSLDWNFVPEAVSYCKDGFARYSKDMSVPFPLDGLQHYMEALIKTEPSRNEAFPFLVALSDRISANLTRATFDTETLRSAQYQLGQYFASGYPELLKRFYTNQDLEALNAAIFQQTTKHGLHDRVIGNFLSLVRNARMAPAEERLLQNLVTFFRPQTGTPINGTDWNQYIQYRSQLASFYTKRHEYSRGAAWMESDFLKNPRAADYRDELITIARLYRLAGRTDDELRALRLYYQYASRYQIQPEPVQRYLDLLYSKNAAEEIKNAATTPDLTAINYFFEHNDQSMSVLAIESFRKRKNIQPQWETTQIAMLGWQLRDASDFFDEKFKTALDIRTIGELLVPEHDITKTLEGDHWFFYGRKYGEYLYWTSGSASENYLNSDLEGLPTAADRQDDLGAFYTQQKQYGRALDHYDLALHLAPRNMLYVDHKARSLMALNRRDDAIHIWKEMIANAEERDRGVAWNMVLMAGADFHFMDELRKDAEAFLSDRIARSGDFNASALYLKNTPEPDAAQLISKWTPTAPAPAQFGRSLLRLELGPAIDRQIFDVVNSYLESRISTAAGTEKSALNSEWYNWNRKYVTWLVKQKAYDPALQVISKLSEHFDSPDDQRTKAEILLMKAKTLSDAKRYPEALEVLREFVKPKTENEESYERQERYKRAIQTAQGLAELELPLKEELYTWLLASGDTSDSTYAGLAEVKLQRDALPEADELFRKMIYLNGENLQGFSVAAELYEKFKLWKEAVALRQELAQRKPWDFSNLAHESYDLLQLDNNTDAAAAAKTVLTSASATAEDRALTASVYGKSSTGAMGPAEMIEIEKASRGENSNPGAYAWHLRAWLLDETEKPASGLVQAQFFLNPDDPGLETQLFRAYSRENKCEQALDVIDPNEQRLSGYVSTDWEDEYDEYRYNSNNYPIESLNLTDLETHDLALDAAGCVAKTKDIPGQIFFLKMAQNHTENYGEKENTNRTIAGLQKTLDSKEEQQSARYLVGLNLGRANQ